MEKKGNEILLTSKGKQLLELVPEDLKKPELTASWEMELAKIAKGAHKEQVFIKDIESYTKELIRDIKTSDGTFRHDNLTNTKMPALRQAYAFCQRQELPHAGLPGP